MTACLSTSTAIPSGNHNKFVLIPDMKVSTHKCYQMNKSLKLVTAEDTSVSVVYWIMILKILHIAIVQVAKMSEYWMVMQISLVFVTDSEWEDTSQ